jgi:hypothetical protein
VSHVPPPPSINLPPPPGGGGHPAILGGLLFLRVRELAALADNQITHCTMFGIIHVWAGASTTVSAGHGQGIHRGGASLTSSCSHSAENNYCSSPPSASRCVREGPKLSRATHTANRKILLGQLQPRTACSHTAHRRRGHVFPITPHALSRAKALNKFLLLLLAKCLPARLPSSRSRFLGSRC